MIKAIKKRMHNNKGFTLIEIIVVLVILAVLAAATVPSILGYIEEARGKAYAAEARVGYVAAQAAVTEIVALNGVVESGGTCGVQYTLGAATDAELTAFGSFVALTEEVEGVFSEIKLSASGNSIKSVTYRTGTDVPYYRIVIEKDKQLVIDRITDKSDDPDVGGGGGTSPPDTPE